MSDDRAAAIEALLVQASDAHHVFERDELHGDYDEAWPAWYGRHIAENGLAAALGRDITGDEIGAYLQRTWETFRDMDPKPTESWAAWTAMQIARHF